MLRLVVPLALLVGSALAGQEQRRVRQLPRLPISALKGRFVGSRMGGICHVSNPFGC